MTSHDNYHGDIASAAPRPQFSRGSTYPLNQQIDVLPSRSREQNKITSDRPPHIDSRRRDRAVAQGRWPIFWSDFPSKAQNTLRAVKGIRLCCGANVLPGYIDWSDVASLDETRRAEFPAYELRPADIVIAMDRPWISSGFKVAQISAEDAPSLLVQRVARVRAKQSEDSDFLYFLIRLPLFMKHCKPTETTVPHISPTEIKSFSFYCPPASTRARFGALMREHAPLLSAQKDHLRKLDTAFSAFQHRAFQGQL